MEIKKLSFSNSAWGDFNKNVELKLNSFNSENVIVEYSKGINLKVKFVLSGADLKRLNEKLDALDLHKWSISYTQPVLDGEEWELKVEFKNGIKKKSVGLNGYPSCWSKFLAVIEWLENKGQNQTELTYTQAKEIALRINPEVNFCREYAEAFHFFDINGEARTPDNDVVVIKKSGKILNFTNFVINFKPEHNAKTIKF